MKQLIVLLLCICLSRSIIHAQQKYLSGDYWVENYTKKQGLPENIIIAITQDKKGYMWMTTPYSLVRFDGLQFRVFSPNKQNSGEYIHFYPGLLEDKDGMIWIGSNNRGLFMFNPANGQFTNYPEGDKPNTITSGMVNCLLEDKDGKLWVGTSNGLNRLTKTSNGVVIEKFSLNYPATVLNGMDRIVANNPLVAGFSKVGDMEKMEAELNISATMELMVVGAGEGNSAFADYGWLTDANGKILWTMEPKKSFSAGGASKNRLQLDVITLQPGKYKLFYTSDDTHAWKNWNEPPPTSLSCGASSFLNCP